METDLARSLGWAAVDWIEKFLVHGPGDVQGQVVELDDEFIEFIVRAYAVDVVGARIVRRAFLSRAKGRSKSGLAAFLVAFEALGPCRFSHFAVAGEVSSWGYIFDEGEPVGAALDYVEILNVATEESQAGNTYDAVYYMVHPDTCSADLLAVFGRVDVGLTRVVLPGSRGFIEPVTSADTSKDGGKSTFIVADETHLWTLPRLHRLHGIMTRNLLKRKVASGWMLETSTMYAEGQNSVAEGTHAYALSSARSRGALLFDHRQAGMSWSLGKRSERLQALAEAYGPAAAWMNLEAIADTWDDPQQSEAEFRRFWLNQPVALVAPAESVLPMWAVLASAEVKPEVGALAVAMTVSRAFVSVGTAANLPTGEVMLDLVMRSEGAGWLAEFLLVQQKATGCPVFIDERSPAGSLIAGLVGAGVVVTPVGLEGFVAACAGVVDSSTRAGLRHTNDAVLNSQVAGASWRVVNDRRVWARRRLDVDALEAVTLAHWGLLQSRVYDPLGSFQPHMV